MKTTKENVRSQLMYEWGDTNEEGELVPVILGTRMSQEEADKLIEKHRDIFDHCQAMASYAYYTANQILRAENQGNNEKEQA